MLKHNPIVDIEKVISHYSLKDGVPIKYVCSSSIRERGSVYDIFYREDGSPHPQFGNRYFGIILFDGLPYIGNADNIENLLFYTIDGVYSQNQHDMRKVEGGYLDGGRDYLRIVGNPKFDVVTYKVKDGNFVPDN